VHGAILSIFCFLLYNKEEMTPTLYLTAEERTAFDAFSEDLREGWDVKEETSDAYETSDELNMRAHMASFPEWMKELAEKIMEEKTEDISLDAVPEEALPDLFFTIGAQGVSWLMGLFIKNVKTDEDLQGLAAFSQIRHELLLSNIATPA